MERAAALQCLETGLASGTLPGKDVEFASSLVTQGKRRGLSERQWFWVIKLARALAGTDTASVGGFSGVYSMFEKAASHLTYPKIHLHTAAGRTLKIYVSGARSRMPGVVNVVDSSDNTWYGRVHADGKWEKGNISDEALGDVSALLSALAKEPERVAAEYGKLTGHCCFCSRSLKDDRSTDVGYGPVCASRYGLKWGK